MRRREGLEKPEYPTPELEGVLGKTLGVPLFQEQAMQVAIVCAGFTPGEADQLRRSMATFKITGGVRVFHDKMINGMVERGYGRDFAERTFKQIEGFGSYGFPESHAASFALIALRQLVDENATIPIFSAPPCSMPSRWVFTRRRRSCGTPRDHGVEILPVCVNASRWDSTLVRASAGKYLAVRLGLRLARGFANHEAAALVIARAEVPFASVAELHDRTRVSAGALERLAEADAFSALGLSRRAALWHIRALAGLRSSPCSQKRENYYRTGRGTTRHAGRARSGRRLSQHWVEPARAPTVLHARRSAHARHDCNHGSGGPQGRARALSVAGIVLVRQKPGSARGGHVHDDRG